MMKFASRADRWFSALLVAAMCSFLSAATYAQEEDEGEADEASETGDAPAERDMRPARERFPLETDFAVGRWVLEFDYDQPDSVVIEHDDGSRERIWYQTFSVRNPTERRLPLRISGVLTTDVERGPKDTRIPMTYKDGASPLAEAAVEARLGPLENTATEMRGMKREAQTGELKENVKLSFIEPGELRKGIAIFGAVTDHADSFSIEYTGLVDTIKYERKEVVSEIKALRIDYTRRGDEYERQLDTLKKIGDEWVIKKRTRIRDRLR